MTAEELVDELKVYTDKMHAICKKASFPENIIYAEKEYGLMQRTELNEIMCMFEQLKQKVDTLHEECVDIPAEKQGRLASPMIK